MSCISCGSSGCTCTNSYTLPSGSTGATGAAGPQGVAGSAGAIYLFNQAIGVSTSTTSFETLYTYTFANPSSTASASKADTAGDKLIFKAYYSTNNILTYDALANDKRVRIKFGGLDLIGAAFPFHNGQYGIILELHVTRITATSAFIEYYIYTTLGTTLILNNSVIGNYIATPVTIPSLDSGTPAFITEADSITAGDITLDWLKIELIKKQ